ncbi:MAG: Flp family type IVb pilin [Pseudomonadota bacterium]
MRKLFSKFKSDESGATAIEYALIAALIAVAIIGAVESLGDEIDSTFVTISDELSTAASGAAGGGGGGGGGPTP